MTTISRYCELAAQTAKEHGFHELDTVYGADSEVEHALKLAALARIVSEIGEAVEALRNDDPKSEKIPYSHVEEEIADTVIRIFDFCGYYGYDLEGAIDAKMAYNTKRAYKHGKVS